MGCGSAEIDDPTFEGENVSEVEQAVGEGQSCLGASCDSGLTCCGATPPDIIPICRNLSNDEDNCGTCGHKCPSATACVSGTCQCTNPALTLCGSQCVNLEFNHQHCGSCNHHCTAIQSCFDGVCEFN